jgi:pimeloyl-ACP methyl ester carboxylesterase
MGAVGSVLRRVAAAGEQRERSYQVVALEAAQGLVQARYWPAPAAPLPSAGTGRSARAGVVWLGGPGGGWDSPARGLYPALAEALQREGVASVRVRYRRRGDLAACAQDAVEGVRFLRQQGCPAVALVGHSFGGAVAVQAAAREPRVRSVVTLATQGLGTDPVVRLGPDCALLAVHGTADTRLPPACSARLWEDAHDPKRLVLFDGAGHGLDEVAPEVRALLGAWLREWLAGPP